MIRHTGHRLSLALGAVFNCCCHHYLKKSVSHGISLGIILIHFFKLFIVLLDSMYASHLFYCVIISTFFSVLIQTEHFPHNSVSATLFCLFAPALDIISWWWWYDSDRSIIGALINRCHFSQGISWGCLMFHLCFTSVLLCHCTFFLFSSTLNTFNNFPFLPHLSISENPVRLFAPALDIQVIWYGDGANQYSLKISNDLGGVRNNTYVWVQSCYCI